ncbi:MAG: beta strand repeat-containing protein [Niveispirillum sp.]|uniref:beta strand repeat-containing protein n=1 Tax=Niveispirillum sp. TaxID=1917217 RepID=UPI003BA749CA
MPSLKTVLDAAITAGVPATDEIELFRDVLNQAGMVWGGERVSNGATDRVTMVDDRLDSWSDYRTVAVKELGIMYRNLQVGEILHFVWNNGTRIEAHSVIVYAVDKVNAVVTAFDAAGTGGAPRLFTLQPETIQGPVQVQTFNNSRSENLRGDIKEQFENSIDGGDGNDTIDGGLGNDTLIGASGDDSLIGGYGDDSLEGGFGNDTLIATAGNDALVGGVGIDRLIGGSGRDRFVFARTSDTRQSTALTFNSMDMIVNFDFGGNGNLLGDSAELPFAVNSVASSTVLRATGVSFYEAMNGLFARGRPLYDTNSAGLFSYLGEVYLVVSGPTRTNNLGSDDFIFRLQSYSGALDVTDFGYSFTVTDATGKVTVNTTAASYTLSATQDNISYLGTGTFRGFGNDRDNSITGGDGNDTLDGGAGADTLTGGDGNDTYVIDNTGDTIVDTDGVDTVRTSLSTATLAADMEHLQFTGTADATGTGNTGDNSITGGTGADTLTGLAGDDTLDGGSGIDSLVGGAGNDAYIVDNPGDVILELAGEGTDVVRARAASYTLGAEVEDLIYVGVGAFSGTGNGLNNSITGGTGADTLNGGAGIDTLVGGGGDDLLVGGAGNDIYVVTAGSATITELAGEGTDTVRTSLVAFTLAAEVDNLVYTGTAAFAGNGNAGDNVLTGAAAADTLTGAAGNDSLDGAAGADRLVGGLGDDVYIVDNAGDVVVEAAGEGTDTVRTSLTSATLGANVENLVYTGGGNFIGTGNGLANAITGGVAADTLTGGGGADTLTGGTGADSFVLSTATQSPAATPITIADFSTVDGDRIDLSGMDADSGTAADDAFTFIGAAAFTNVAGQLRIQVVGTDLQVLGDINGDGTADFAITLTAVTTLAATDLVL